MPHHSEPYLDRCISEDCGAQKFNISKGTHVPISYRSSLFCKYQNLQVLKYMRSLYLALTTPHTGRSICRLEVKDFSVQNKSVSMDIYDTDLQGHCILREGAVSVEVVQDTKTKQFSTIRIPRRLGEVSLPKKENTRLFFTEFNCCLIFITSFDHVYLCELFVVSDLTSKMHDTPCHSIYRLYCGYGRPTRDPFPEPLNSSSDALFLKEAQKLRLLIEVSKPLKEDTIFMNEFQMIAEVFYHIPEANLYASSEHSGKRLCGVQIYQVFPDSANLDFRVISSSKNYTIASLSYYIKQMNAFSPTIISLVDHQVPTDHLYNRGSVRQRRVLVSNFRNCYLLKSVNDGARDPLCELFLKNNTDPYPGLDECWFMFLAFCGYPAVVYSNTSCYTESTE
ncbi:uncharacterized protein LOC115322752 [Ixodes scapularis]|uniref:uncharacterized protein LOC115322752 n=1 Tax=Ixodes scapularis TaxID=6945 RepID=UPI001A9E93A0|nr:uncharacterized protein LOC115322752 [Ixodes scapularis]